MITNLPVEEIPAVAGDPGLNLVLRDNPSILYLGLNNRFPPFDDIRVRRALAVGLDRQRLVDNYFSAGSSVASHFVPCLVPNGCVGESWYGYDPDLGRQLLAEAGYPDGFDTTIYFRDVVRSYLPDPAGFATDLQRQLSENLGIEAALVNMSAGEFIVAATGGNLDGPYLLGWIADYPHPSSFLDFHFNPRSPQFGDPFPEIFEPVAQAAVTADPGEAARLYAQANDAIRELVPMVPLAHSTSASAARADLENAYAPPDGFVDFARLDPGADQLTYMQVAEPRSLYCADETDEDSFRACRQVVETLYSFTPDSGETLPALATACSSNGEATVWTCSLRPEILFHDGTTLDANDVVFSWGVAIDAAHPLHIGNGNGFSYHSFIWGALMNDGSN